MEGEYIVSVPFHAWLLKILYEWIPLTTSAYIPINIYWKKRSIYCVWQKLQSNTSMVIKNKLNHTVSPEIANIIMMIMMYCATFIHSSFAIWIVKELSYT